jgi:hypothetical protein
VVGVRGNHDFFVDQPADAGAGLHRLEGTRLTLDGLVFGGVGGVIGNPSKPRTRSEERFTQLVRSVARGGIDVLVLHQGPEGNDDLSGATAPSGRW